MVATLNGAIASDTPADGRVISGVGGQYNFVAMAHASIIMIRANAPRTVHEQLMRRLVVYALASSEAI